jgi:hypothetical protein
VAARWRPPIARAAERFSGADYAAPDPLLSGAALPFTAYIRALARRAPPGATEGPEEA